MTRLTLDWSVWFEQTWFLSQTDFKSSPESKILSHPTLQNAYAECKQNVIITSAITLLFYIGTKRP